MSDSSHQQASAKEVPEFSSIFDSSRQYEHFGEAVASYRDAPPLFQQQSSSIQPAASMVPSKSSLPSKKDLKRPIKDYTYDSDSDSLYADEESLSEEPTKVVKETITSTKQHDVATTSSQPHLPKTTSNKLPIKRNKKHPDNNHNINKEINTKSTMDKDQNPNSAAHPDSPLPQEKPVPLSCTEFRKRFFKPEDYITSFIKSRYLIPNIAHYFEKAAEEGYFTEFNDEGNGFTSRRSSIVEPAKSTNDQNQKHSPPKRKWHKPIPSESPSETDSNESTTDESSEDDVTDIQLGIPKENPTKNVTAKRVLPPNYSSLDKPTKKKAKTTSSTPSSPLSSQTTLDTIAKTEKMGSLSLLAFANKIEHDYQHHKVVNKPPKDKPKKPSKRATHSIKGVQGLKKLKKIKETELEQTDVPISNTITIKIKAPRKKHDPIAAKAVIPTDDMICTICLQHDIPQESIDRLSLKPGHMDNLQKTQDQRKPGYTGKGDHWDPRVFIKCSQCGNIVHCGCPEFPIKDYPSR